MNVWVSFASTMVTPSLTGGDKRLGQAGVSMQAGQLEPRLEQWSSDRTLQELSLPEAGAMACSCR